MLIEGDWKLRRNGSRALGTRMVGNGPNLPCPPLSKLTLFYSPISNTVHENRKDQLKREEEARKRRPIK